MTRPIPDVVLSREFTDEVRKALDAKRAGFDFPRTVSGSFTCKVDQQTIDTFTQLALHGNVFTPMPKAISRVSDFFEKIIGMPVGPWQKAILNAAPPLGILHAFDKPKPPTDLDAIANAALANVPHWKPACCSQPLPRTIQDF